MVKALDFLQEQGLAAKLKDIKGIEFNDRNSEIAAWDMILTYLRGHPLRNSFADVFRDGFKESLRTLNGDNLLEFINNNKNGFNEEQKSMIASIFMSVAHNHDSLSASYWTPLRRVINEAIIAEKKDQYIDFSASNQNKALTFVGVVAVIDSTFGATVRHPLPVELLESLADEGIPAAESLNPKIRALIRENIDGRPVMDLEGWKKLNKAFDELFLQTKVDEIDPEYTATRIMGALKSGKDVRAALGVVLRTCQMETVTTKPLAELNGSSQQALKAVESQTEMRIT